MRIIRVRPSRGILSVGRGRSRVETDHDLPPPPGSSPAGSLMPQPPARLAARCGPVPDRCLLQPPMRCHHRRRRRSLPPPPPPPPRPAASPRRCRSRRAAAAAAAAATTVCRRYSRQRVREDLWRLGRRASSITVRKVAPVAPRTQPAVAPSTGTQGAAVSRGLLVKCESGGDSQRGCRAAPCILMGLSPIAQNVGLCCGLGFWRGDSGKLLCGVGWDTESWKLEIT